LCKPQMENGAQETGKGTKEPVNSRNKKKDISTTGSNMGTLERRPLKESPDLNPKTMNKKRAESSGQKGGEPKGKHKSGKVTGGRKDFGGCLK